MSIQLDNTIRQIEEIVNRHAATPGCAIPILQEIQKTFGYVAPSFLHRVSELTNIPTSELFSIVTFYSQFRLEPLGENHIQVCFGTACHIAGAQRLSDALEHATKTSCGCTSADGKFSVEKVACLGCCSLAPVVNVNGTIHGRLTPEKVKDLIKEVAGDDKALSD